VGLQASVVTLCSCRLISEARHKLYFLVVWIALVWPGVVRHHFCCPSCHLNVCMVLPDMRLSLVHAGFIAHRLGFTSLMEVFPEDVAVFMAHNLGFTSLVEIFTANCQSRL
jgi:hypothetical protein